VKVPMKYPNPKPAVSRSYKKLGQSHGERISESPRWLVSLLYLVAVTLWVAGAYHLVKTFSAIESTQSFFNVFLFFLAGAILYFLAGHDRFIMTRNEITNCNSSES